MVTTALNPAEKITFSPLISNAHSVVYTDAEGQVQREVDLDTNCSFVGNARKNF